MWAKAPCVCIQVLPVQVQKKLFMKLLLILISSPPSLFFPAFLYSFIPSCLPFVSASEHSSILSALWLRALWWKTKCTAAFHEPPLQQAIFLLTSMGTTFFVPLEWTRVRACVHVRFVCGCNNSTQRKFYSDWDTKTLGEQWWTFKHLLFHFSDWVQGSLQKFCLLSFCSFFGAEE